MPAGRRWINLLLCPAAMRFRVKASAGLQDRRTVAAASVKPARLLSLIPGAFGETVPLEIRVNKGSNSGSSG
jgi:hypothetical protein